MRKRTWKKGNGEKVEAWVVDYSDGEGRRRLKTFQRKSEAKAWAATTTVQIKDGTHVPDSATVTVAEAGKRWIEACQGRGLEPSTIDRHKQHLELHIKPLIGREKLSKVTVPFVRSFEDLLRKTPVQTKKGPRKRSADGVRRAVGALGALLSNAQEEGLVAVNAVHALRGRRSNGTGQDRHKRKLKVGVDIPTPDEVRRLLGAAEALKSAKAKGTLFDGWRTFLLVAIFAGLRASELRGLRWEDVDLEKNELHVHQRADKYNTIGSPKSSAGQRTVPLPPNVVQELREWKLMCPKKDGKLGLVFPNSRGNVENHTNLVARGLIPSMVAAGIVTPVRDELGVPKRGADGKPVVEAKYTGLHALRHFFASWSINRRADGGRELPAKVVQELLGHSSITMTMDVYGHLFPRGDDRKELAAAERLLLGIA